MFRGAKARCAITLVLSLCAAACTGADSATANAPPTATGVVDAKITGVGWVTNYIPEKELSPALLLSMQSDKIMVRFEEGTVRTVSSSINFERRYRITDISGETFHIIVEDEGGIEYDAVCQLDDLGSMSFQSLTDPWKGRGVLTREGPSLKPND
jgi:hypothetical protein